MDRPTRVSLALAVLAHLLVLEGALVAVRPRAAVRDTSVTEEVAAIEIVEPESPTKAVEAEPAPVVAQAAPAAVAPMTKPLAHLTTTVPSAGPAASTGEVAPAPSGEVAKAEPTNPKPVIPELIDTSSPGKHSFILPPSSSGKPMTKEEAIAAKLDASVKGSLDAKAQVVDGGYGGPVVSAAHAAASSIQAPQVGYATFDIETDGKGIVTTVKLVDYGGDLGWQRVQKELQANLSTQTLKVPTGANGVHVRVRVDADMKLPSGAKKKIEGAGIEGIGFGFKFDVADIGATKHRVVGVKLVEQHRL